MQRVALFIKTHWDRWSPLLLGYSGGPDSKALLYALLEIPNLSLHVAHVDHGWRESSASEAAMIREEIESLGLAFHTLRLTPPLKGNKEAVARGERFAFFCELKKRISFQACLLAHHAADLAETSLKRVLEGAHLPLLGGMQEISSFEELTIWRPFLGAPRSEILSFLEKKRLQPLMDPSNHDPAYLRARMRTDIFPFLKEKFGKEVEGNLALLAQRSFELKEYLDRQVEKIPIHKGPWGSLLSFASMARIEARHLLQKIHPLLPRDFLESILDALMAKKANRRFSKTLFVDRGDLFLLSPKAPRFERPLPLTLGVHLSGHWRIEVCEWKKPLPEPCWTDVWKGSFSVELAHGMLALPAEGTPLRVLWNQKKVPSFLRFQLPLFVQEGKEIKEFLSGKRREGTSSVFQVNFSVISSD